MKKLGIYLLALMMITTGCINKELCEECCEQGTGNIKVVVHWDDKQDARAMRMNVFSQTDGVLDYGRDNIPEAGVRYIELVSNASYLPYCYDYYATNVYFRDETTIQYFEAYLPESTRNTYNTLAKPVVGEKTVLEPGEDFFVHSWQETFDVEWTEEELTLDFYPKNIVREFTFRIYNIQGAKHIQDAKGAASGMAATYHFYEDELTTVRSTVLFENAKAGTDNSGGYIEGVFRTFGPVYPYANRFTIEIISGSNYYTAYWDVSGQISESMTDREAKLARDGFDILIKNDKDIPDIPEPETDKGSGFEVGVGDWDNVEIYL